MVNRNIVAGVSISFLDVVPNLMGCYYIICKNNRRITTPIALLLNNHTFKVEFNQLCQRFGGKNTKYKQDSTGILIGGKVKYKIHVLQIFIIFIKNGRHTATPTIRLLN